MGVPTTYRKQDEKAISSYNFTDIADGTGHILLYGMGSNTSGTVDYHLIKTTLLFSTPIETNTSLATGAATKELDLDFDGSPQKLPIVVEGTMYVNVPLGSSQSAGTATTYVIVKFRKWDGSSETEIVSGQSQNYVPAADLSTVVTIPLTVPKTLFKIGETLRVTVEAWGSMNTGTGEVAIGHDPQNRDGTYVKNYVILKASIPYKIDL